MGVRERRGASLLEEAGLLSAPPPLRLSRVPAGDPDSGCGSLGVLPWTWTGPALGGPTMYRAPPALFRELAQAFLPAAAEVRARLGRRAVPATAPRRGLCPHVQTILGLRLQRAAPSHTVPHSQPARPSHVSVLQSQMPAALLDSMEWVALGPPDSSFSFRLPWGQGHRPS